MNRISSTARPLLIPWPIGPVVLNYVVVDVCQVMRAAGQVETILKLEARSRLVGVRPDFVEPWLRA